jgi:hypothetical protein
LFQERWQEIFAEDQAQAGRRRGPGRPQNLAMGRAKDEFASQNFFNNGTKKELQAERNRIATALHYGRDLANFVKEVFGSPDHPDAQTLFLVMPFEQIVRLARSTSMSLVPDYVRQWAFGRMVNDKYLIMDGIGSTAKKMKSFTATLAGLMAPYIFRGELLVRLHTNPLARQLGLAPVAQLQSDLNALVEEYSGLNELPVWPDILSDLSKDPLDVFAKVVELSGGFPDIVWENELSGEKRVIVTSEDLLMRVEDATMDLDALDVVKVIMASEPRTEWMIVSAMDIQEGNVPLGDQVHKWLVVAKAPKHGTVKRHLLCMAVLFSKNFEWASVCIVDPLTKRSGEIRSLCEAIIGPWVVGTTTQVVYLDNLPYTVTRTRTPPQCAAHVIANGIAITQAGKVWPGLLERETETEFSVKWRRYAKQTIMCPRLIQLRLGDGDRAASDDDSSNHDDLYDVSDMEISDEEETEERGEEDAEEETKEEAKEDAKEEAENEDEEESAGPKVEGMDVDREVRDSEMGEIM